MVIIPLNHHYAMENPATIYDEEALTALQLAGRTTAKVNEVVNAQNELTETTKQRLDTQDAAVAEMIGKTMPAKVTEEFQKNVNNGTFEKMIDRYAGNLEDRLDDFVGSVPEGSTTLDVEVIDIRTLNHEKHTNAGSAVRAIDSRVNGLVERADGGRLIFDNDYDKLTHVWSAGATLPACMAIESDCVKWYYNTDADISNPGFSMPAVGLKEGAKVYLDFELSKVTDDMPYQVFVSATESYVAGSCTLIDTIYGSKHASYVIDPAMIGHAINYVFVLAQPSAITGYENMWCKISELTCGNNAHKDAGFSGKTIDAHLLELKRKVDNLDEIGVDTLADSYEDTYEVFGVGSKPDYIVPNGDAITFEGVGNIGVGFQNLVVDPNRYVHFEFDIEHVNDSGVKQIGVYISNGACMQPYSNIWSANKDGHYRVSFDPAFYDMYHNINVTAVHLIAHTDPATTRYAKTTLSNFRIYQSAVVDAGGYPSLEKCLVDLYGGAVRETVEEISDNIRVSPNGYHYVIQTADDGTILSIPAEPRKALYIGNSILMGWGFGVAASDSEKDYYALMNNVFTEKRADFAAERVSGYNWEACTTTAAQTAWCNDELLPYLSDDLDLVFIQLSDNVNTDEKKAVLYSGAVNLISYIRTRAPKARVVWAANWYGSATMRTDISAACKKGGAMFIDYSDLHTPENESAIGNTYTDVNGNTHTIDSAGVASHPGDKGMRALANRFLYALGVADNENTYI